MQYFCADSIAIRRTICPARWRMQYWSSRGVKNKMYQMTGTQTVDKAHNTPCRQRCHLSTVRRSSTHLIMKYRPGLLRIRRSLLIVLDAFTPSISSLHGADGVRELRPPILWWVTGSATWLKFRMAASGMVTGRVDLRDGSGRNILNALCEFCSFYGVFDRYCNEKVSH